MNLYSCDTCGVVLDRDKIPFPEAIYAHEGCVDTNLAVWDGDTFVPKTQCPVCHGDILK